MSDTENIANAKKVSNTRDEPAALAQIRAQQVAAQARGPDTTLQRKLSVLSPKKPPSGAENNLSTGSSRSGSSKSSGNIKSGVPVSAITIYEDNRKQMALSPSRNRNPAQQTQVFDAMSVAESSVNSPFKLRKPEETDSLNNTFTFSVQDVDVSTVHSMASARPTRSPSAHSSSPNPRAKQLGSLNSSGKHAAAALLLNRSSSGVVPPLRDGCSSPLTPSSILRLKQQQRASGSLSPVVSRVHTPTRTHQARTPLIHLPAGASAGSADIRNAEQLMEPLEHLRMSECESIVPEQQEEEGREEELPQMQLPVVPHRAAHHHPHETQQSAFAHILDRVRGSIGTGLVQVGSVLGARAEKALADTSHLLPLYSTTEMNQVMTKKYDLLSELSHSCMLLGEAEAKEKAYAEQLAHMRALEDQVSDLQTALEEAQQSKESLQFKVKAAETEVSVLKVEKAEDKELLSTYQAEIKQQNEQLTAQAAQISTMDERLSSATAENNHLRSEWRDREGLWQTQLLTVQEENRVYREQAQSCTATLQAAQAERDHSVAELEVLQEMAAADKQAAMSEFARLREGMASQQYLYKEQLIKHDAEMHQLRRALSEAQSGLEAITELHKASEHAKAQLETKVASASAEVLQLTAKYTMCQQDLRASEEAKEYNRKLAVQAQSQLKEQQMQLVISSSEHGMLSDQARLAALTVEALHSEINMLRRDLEVQRDEISQKGIELKTATTKQHGAEELIESLRTEMATALANSADDLQGKDEEIDQLKQTLDMLRQDRANETEDLTRLTAERDSCAREVSELKEVSATSSARVSELSAQLGAATQKIRDLEQEKMELVEARQTVVAEMNSDMDAMKSILSNQLSAMQTEKAAEAAVSSDIITSLKRNFSEAEAQFHTALQQRDSELSSVRSKASCVEDTLSQVRQEMTRLSAEHRQQLARKDDEIVALAEKYQQAEARARELSASHDKAMSSATQRFEQREKEFLSALSLAEDTQDSLRSDLHQQLSQTSKQCTEQSLLIKDLQAKLQESLVVASSKADEITLRVEEIALLRSEVQDKAAQIALLESKATVAADAAKQSSAQMAKIKEDVAALKQQLQAKSAEADKAGALAAFQQTSFAMKEDKLTQEMQLLQVFNSVSRPAADFLQFLICMSLIFLWQSQLDTSADKLAASTSARRTERAQLFVALQGVQMELAELRSNLKETKVDIAGLGGVHSSIVR